MSEAIDLTRGDVIGIVGVKRALSPPTADDQRPMNGYVSDNGFVVAGGASDEEDEGPHAELHRLIENVSAAPDPEAEEAIDADLGDMQGYDTDGGFVVAPGEEEEEEDEEEEEGEVEVEDVEVEVVDVEDEDEVEDIEDEVKDEDDGDKNGAEDQDLKPLV